MALVSQVESRSWRGRSVYAVIFALLILGSLTMVYPFAVMVAGSFRSDMDAHDLSIIPRFWIDRDELHRKLLETKYNGKMASVNIAHQDSYFAFGQIPVEQSLDPAIAAELRKWLSGDVPLHWQILGGLEGHRTVPESLRELRKRLKVKYGGDLDALSRDIGTPLDRWQAFIVPAPDWASFRYSNLSPVVQSIYRELLVSADPAQRQVVSITGHFLHTMIWPRHGAASLTWFNEQLGTNMASFAEYRFPDRYPADAPQSFRALWGEFVRNELNPAFILVDGATAEEYAAYQRTARPDEPTHPLPDGRTWLEGDPRQSYEDFLQTIPLERLRIFGPDYAFGPGLCRAVKSMEAIYVRENSGSLRWTHSIRNYIHVLDEMVVEGRPMANTLIFCGLAITLSLLVNPLAGYALSRFKLNATYKVLMFIMATTAFPAMLALIPQFMLLRELGLLNTFVALLMPVVVNGYWIFMLKGFFDSLPREVYESARIDGAGEARLFFQFTMALSTPILAVLALNTFTAAYMMFLYPLIVAPDPDMWLISVWLYQFQQRVGSGAVYASIIIASIPTLLIFVFAQRTIMRGIVVPSEK